MDAMTFIAQALNDFAATLPPSVRAMFQQTATNALTAISEELAKVPPASPQPSEALTPYINGSANPSHLDN